ncbi:hypothetical protein V4F39_10865 [Aquincola sp. MAHUQ-54]|uniref:Uncharacterized protein n=1 Tax=Aquincola agrisoli TaxID=3119538 RepID=A0AAW9QII9_9BURK
MKTALAFTIAALGFAANVAWATEIPSPRAAASTPAARTAAPRTPASAPAAPAAPLRPATRPAQAADTPPTTLCACASGDPFA